MYGALEPSLATAHDLVATGGSSVALWIVPGASHGDYLTAAGSDEYARRVGEWMVNALGG